MYILVNLFISYILFMLRFSLSCTQELTEQAKVGSAAAQMELPGWGNGGVVLYRSSIQSGAYDIRPRLLCPVRFTFSYWEFLRAV